MSLSSTASARRPARAAIAVAVAVAVLAPLAVLGAQLWTSSREATDFAADERVGVEYLVPLTRLLAVTTEAQSAAVRGEPVDAAEVREAVSEVQTVDDQLGRVLGTTDRWATLRVAVEDRLERGWPRPSEAYTQFSDLTTLLTALTRVVGDNSRLILDPSVDSYYVMNATLLRVPRILVDSGRYADLGVIAPDRRDARTQAQQMAFRNRIATDWVDLTDGLSKAFAQTSSRFLASSLTRQQDNLRIAVDRVAPSTSLLAPAPERSAADLGTDQENLRGAALDFQVVALAQLDLLLAERQAEQRRIRTIGFGATGFGVLVAIGVGLLVWRSRPVPAAEVPDLVPVPDLVSSARPGGARAAR